MWWFKNQLPLTSCITTGTFNHILIIPTITTGNNKERFPICDLNTLVYNEVCTELNKSIPGKDYEALAGHMGYSAGKLKTFQSKENSSDALLSDWGTKFDNDVKKLIVLLTKMERDDLIELLEGEKILIYLNLPSGMAKKVHIFSDALITVSKSPNNAINGRPWAFELANFSMFVRRSKG